MKKKLLLVSGAVLLLMTSLVVMSCGSDDDVDSERDLSTLYGRWVLQGYVSNGNTIFYENRGIRDCYLFLKEDGNFDGQFCNQLQGEYSFNQNGDFLIISCVSTMIWSTDSVLMFMEEQIGKMKISSFALEGDCLNLYFSPKDYLKFTR